MSGARVLVTGARGFLGRHLVGELIKRDASVVVVVRPGGLQLPSEWASRVEVREWDLKDGRRPQGVFQGVGTVVHLVAKYLPGSSGRTLEELRGWNVKPLAGVISACLESGVRRLMHLSSVAACEFSSGNVVTEDGGEPVTAYGRSKRESEELLHAIPTTRLAWTIFRPTALYGEHGLGTMAEIVRALEKRRFAIFGDGNNAVNFSYAGNIAAAMLKCEGMPVTHGRTYILSDGGIPLVELDRTLREILGFSGRSLRLPVWAGYAAGLFLDAVSLLTRKRMPLSLARVRAATVDRVYSADRLRVEVGFKPPFGFREALERTIRWYREQGVID